MKTYRIGVVAAVCVALLLVKNPASGQTNDEAGKNIVKLNVGSFVFKTFSAQFEHAIAPKTSIGLGLRAAPKGRLPFSETVADILEDEQLNELRTGNFAITPEVKFYFGKGGVFNGFYIAPFLRAAFYEASVDYRFSVYGQEQMLPFSGDFSSFTAGVAVGAQWRLAKSFYLDWTIVGPHYGFSKGKVTGYRSLSAEEQQALREELRDLDNFPVGRVKTTVDESGAAIDFDGPRAGLRMNVGIGYRF